VHTSPAIELTDFPSMLNLYRRAITRRKPATRTQDLPTITVSLSGIKIDRQRLTTYRELCGFKDNGLLPITYPQILAFPLHMEILVNKNFPYKAMGMVHLNNQITQLRRIKQNEVLDLKSTLEGIEKTAKGDVVTLSTEVTINKELVWTNKSQYLKRAKQTNKSESKKSLEPVSAQLKRARFHAPANIGRVYGRISGDLNPIHLFAVTAKLFGFKQQIAHGLWAKALCLAHLDQFVSNTPVSIEVSFKTPIFLPSDIELAYSVEGDSVSFLLQDSLGEKPHITGKISRPTIL